MSKQSYQIPSIVIDSKDYYYAIRKPKTFQQYKNIFLHG